MQEESTSSGIGVDAPLQWGTHICQFYRTKQDLLETLIPYLEAGLERNERCIWVTADPLSAMEARLCMKHHVADFDTFLLAGQIEIIDGHEWYGDDRGFDPRRVLDAWAAKEEESRQRTFSGLRAAGNTSWVSSESWKRFMEYESLVEEAIKNLSMVALCSYRLSNVDPSVVREVQRHHDASLVKDAGWWSVYDHRVSEAA